MADKNIDSLSFIQDTLPVAKRKCTDVFFLLLLLGAWVCLTFIGLAAMGLISSQIIRKGNPQLLVHGVDYEGNICGVDDIVAHLPRKVYPNFALTTPSSTGAYVPALFAVCVSSCPGKGDTIEDPYGTYGSWEASDDSRAFLNACLFTSETAGETSAVTLLADMAHAAALIGLLGFGLACALSFLFLLIVRVPLLLRGVVWSCAGLIQAILTGGALFFLYQANQRNGGYSSLCHCSTEVALLKAVGGLLLVCAVLWLSVLGFWRSRIALAISLVRESAQALTHMPLICLLPFLQTGLFVCFTALFVYLSLFLCTSGQVETRTDSVTGVSYKLLHFDANTQRALVFSLFAWLWTVGWIEGVGLLSSSHAVSAWYFAPYRGEITSLQILRSLRTVLRYHSGSAALGSLSLTFLRGLRIVIIETGRRLSLSLTTSARSPTRSLCRCLCWLCCGWVGCIERIVQGLTKHAYIHIALLGRAFCPSALSSFVLLSTHLSPLAAVSVVGELVVLIGKLSISLSSAAAGYLYLRGGGLGGRMNGFVLPSLFIFLVAFLTSTLFLSVLTSTSTTLVQACLVEARGGKGRSRSSGKGGRGGGGGGLEEGEGGEERGGLEMGRVGGEREDKRGLYRLLFEERERWLEGEGKVGEGEGEWRGVEEEGEGEGEGEQRGVELTSLSLLPKEREEREERGELVVVTSLSPIVSQIQVMEREGQGEGEGFGGLGRHSHRYQSKERGAGKGKESSGGVGAVVGGKRRSPWESV